MGNFNYNKSLKEKAKYLRSNMTKAEACLWKYVLSGRKLEGYQFRRQRPIGNYIVDFVCLPLMLVIEVDGITHTYGEVAQKDIIRQKRLESLGFKVIRYTDDEVLGSINSVRASILEAIETISKE